TVAPTPLAPAYPATTTLASAERAIEASRPAPRLLAASGPAAASTTGPHPETVILASASSSDESSDETDAAASTKALAVASATATAALPPPPDGPDLPLRGRESVELGMPVDPVALPGFDRPAEPVVVARTVWPPVEEEASLAPEPAVLNGPQAHAAKVTTAATTTAGPATQAGDRYWLQLAAMPDEATAMGEWERRVALTPDTLEGRSPRVVEARVAGVGRVFRLWVGPWESQAGADALCQEIRAVSGPCFVQFETAGQRS
ncbi:MAG: SPOR domain-containing protein, partial [Azospirillaceae bacterium]